MVCRRKKRFGEARQAAGLRVLHAMSWAESARAWSNSISDGKFRMLASAMCVGVVLGWRGTWASFELAPYYEENCGG